jgi:membrane protein DedA with SNARE-associated domain
VWAVFFGRFVALLRIFAGPLAGALRMPYPRFLAAKAVGGLVWACGTTAAVYRLGASVDQWFKDAAWLGLFLAIGVGVAFSTVFRRQLSQAVVRHALLVESRHATTTAFRSQEMPPDGPRRELVP